MCSMANLDRNMALSDRTVARIHQDACVGEVLQSDCLQRGWLVYCRQTKDSDLWPSIPLSATRPLHIKSLFRCKNGKQLLGHKSTDLTNLSPARGPRLLP